MTTVLRYILAFLQDFLKLSFPPVEERHEPVPEPVPQPIATTTPIVPPPPPPQPPPTPKKAMKIYEAAKAGLGKRLTLDPTVPTRVGCVQAVSVVLKNAGYSVPKKGMYGVNELIAWLLKHGFKEVAVPEPGDIVTAHQPVYTNTNWAHCGVMGKYGIMNNNSITGKFTQSYTLQSWHAYFGGRGSKTRYFRAL